MLRNPLVTRPTTNAVTPTANLMRGAEEPQGFQCNFSCSPSSDKGMLTMAPPASELGYWGVTDPDSAFGDLTLCGERGKGVPIRWTIRRDAHGKWEEPLPEEHSLHGRFSLISDLHDQAVEEILLVVSKVRVAAAA